MTDFSTWERKTLEQLARDLLTQNAHLRADVQMLLAAWRNELKRTINLKLEISNVENQGS
tara:strand:+ start:260 stop:439 length:180 start_codon:yes stop_codon:yes gene_type:complete